MSGETKLEMKVDMNVIQHLGISMYATLPPVIAELVSNAWDADATEVRIELNDIDTSDKKIIVKDNGIGMSVEDIQNSFLVIGKNRRRESGDYTPGGRKVMGKKGIGKLSMFGIANEIVVTSIKEVAGKNLKNRFRMNLDDIKRAGTEYHPPHEIINKETDEPSGTTIEIMKIRRKSPFDAHKIAVNLARRFLIFDEHFKVYIKHNDAAPIPVTQDLRFEGIQIEFEWNLPLSELTTDYEHANNVKGKIYTAKTPVPEDMKGIYLVARGKLVHRNDFYGIRASDYAHAYLTGWVEVDFIDEDPEKDNIATNRQELIWENEELQKLRDYLKKIISFVTTQWRKKRRELKENAVREKTGIDINRWVEELDPVSKPIARKLIKSILTSENIDEERTVEMVYFIHDMFEFDTFRKMAAEIIEDNYISEDKVLDLMKKWELVEAREMYKISQVRIDTIINFERLIQENAKEVPIMHNFFKKFPWLLDPRIMEFRDEVTYSKLLKEEFQERDLEDKNRRIDFLCIRFGGIFFVIELKRPGHVLQYKDIEQAKDYRSFIEQHLGTEHNEKIIAYIVVGKIPEGNRKVNDEIDTQKKAQKIFIRTYHELLQNAKNYHRELIDRYNQLKKERDEDAGDTE